MAFDEKYSGEFSGGDNDTRESTKIEIDYADPVSVIEAILDEIDCRNHFTRSRVFMVADRVLREKIQTVREMALHIRFHGPDDFCTRFGNQDDLPTDTDLPSVNPSFLLKQPKPDLEDPQIETTELVDQEVIRKPTPLRTKSASSQSSAGLLRANIHDMKQKIDAAFSAGSTTTQGELASQSTAPSSHRFPTRKP